MFVLPKKIIKQSESWFNGFCEKALIPQLLMLSIIGKYQIRLINNFTKVKKKIMPIFLYWVLEPIIISLINQDRAPHQQQCIYSNIDIKNAVKLSLY